MAGRKKKEEKSVYLRLRMQQANATKRLTGEPPPKDVPWRATERPVRFLEAMAPGASTAADAARFLRDTAWPVWVTVLLHTAFENSRPRFASHALGHSWTFISALADQEKAIQRDPNFWAKLKTKLIAGLLAQIKKKITSGPLGRQALGSITELLHDAHYQCCANDEREPTIGTELANGLEAIADRASGYAAILAHPHTRSEYGVLYDKVKLVGTDLASTLVALQIFAKQDTMPVAALADGGPFLAYLDLLAVIDQPIEAMEGRPRPAAEHYCSLMRALEHAVKRAPTLIDAV